MSPVCQGEGLAGQSTLRTLFSLQTRLSQGLTGATEVEQTVLGRKSNYELPLTGSSCTEKVDLMLTSLAGCGYAIIVEACDDVRRM